MAKPSSSHAARFRQDAGSGDGRLISPTFDRNFPPMLAELAARLRALTGPVLEIGAGTGQHAASFALAFRQLQWRASDPDPLHRASIAAWARFLRAPEYPPLDLDASADWADRPEVAALGPLAAVLSVNVIHIAPRAVLEGIVRGAGRALMPGGLLIFYGPFKEHGRHTGPGNEAFDAGLRAENLAWGVRDIAEVDELAAAAGLTHAETIVMPADNRLVIYERAQGAAHGDA